MRRVAYWQYCCFDCRSDERRCGADARWFKPGSFRRLSWMLDEEVPYVKACVDCKYCSSGFSGMVPLASEVSKARYLCSVSSAKRNGFPWLGKTVYFDCRQMRSEGFGSYCGPSGRLWRPSLWFRLKRGVSRFFKWRNG